MDLCEFKATLGYTRSIQKQIQVIVPHTFNASTRGDRNSVYLVCSRPALVEVRLLWWLLWFVFVVVGFFGFFFSGLTLIPVAGFLLFLLQLLKKRIKLDIIGYNYNTNTWEAEANQSLVQGRTWSTQQVLG